MPSRSRYYCDYCDTFLTHDSPSVRKTHCAGRKHKENVKFYYQKWYEEENAKYIEKVTAAQKAGKAPPPPPFGLSLGIPMMAPLMSAPPPMMMAPPGVLGPPPGMPPLHQPPPMGHFAPGMAAIPFGAPFGARMPMPPMMRPPFMPQPPPSQGQQQPPPPHQMQD